MSRTILRTTGYDGISWSRCRPSCSGRFAHNALHCGAKTPGSSSPVAACGHAPGARRIATPIGSFTADVPPIYCCQPWSQPWPCMPPLQPCHKAMSALLSASPIALPDRLLSAGLGPLALKLLTGWVSQHVGAAGFPPAPIPLWVQALLLVLYSALQATPPTPSVVPPAPSGAPQDPQGAGDISQGEPSRPQEASGVPQAPAQAATGASAQQVGMMTNAWAWKMLSGCMSAAA